MEDWKTILRKNFTNWVKLADFLELSSENRSQILPKSAFPLNLPLRLAEKIEKNNPQDPIFKQFLPLKEEEISKPGFSLDPVGDHAARKTPKLLHKYKGRALLTCTSACAMHCRFCFRQKFPYETSSKDFSKDLEWIENDPTLSEIILSGGDPLSLSNNDLRALFTRLGAIPHLKRWRIHTRFPIGIPERIDQELLSLLETCPLQGFFVIHCNHPQELDKEILKSLKAISRLGIPLLAQTVLLKGINDNSKTLKELFETLVNHGITPYYLHQLDKTQGTHHFEITENQGIEIINRLSEELSGYAVPRYVKEIAGASCKTLISLTP